MTIASNSILTGGEAGTVAAAVAAEVHRPVVEMHRLAIVEAIAAASASMADAGGLVTGSLGRHAVGIPCRPWLLCRHDEGVRITPHVGRFVVVRPGEIETLALPPSCLRDDGSTLSRAGVSIIRTWQGPAPKDIGWSIRRLLAELELRRVTARRLLAKIPKGATLAKALAAMPEEHRRAARKEVTR